VKLWTYNQGQILKEQYKTQRNSQAWNEQRLVVMSKTTFRALLLPFRKRRARKIKVH
jgi:hypothetical protein